MRLVLIACAVIERELRWLAARCAVEIDARYLEQGLHEQPERLRQAVQEEIDRIDAQAAPVDAIVLGYGLCGTGTVGLRSARHRLVMPRAHDCATLALGCRQRYRAEFDAEPGTYWCSTGWVEHGALPDDARLERKGREFAERFDEDAAAYLVQVERDALARYRRCAFVAWPGLSCEPERAAAERAAAERSWRFEALRGDPGLLADLLAGNWDDRFLVAEPGAAIAASYDEGVVTAP